MPTDRKPVRKPLRKAKSMSPSSGGEASTVAAARRVIHVLSDSTGNLAGHMLTAFLTQFPAGAFVVQRVHFLRTPAQVASALATVDAAESIVFHAFVSPVSKGVVAADCARRGIPACDLTGPFVRFLSDASGLLPSDNVRALHEMDVQYERRVQALEFTLEHDDGMRLESIHEADVVLAGVSRTSKTPTSIYLAQQGHRVANVSLAMAVEPPEQLLRLKADKVVGLIIDPNQLARIRKQRNIEWKMSDTSYNDLDRVEEEVRWSRKLFLKHGWPILDVSTLAIEESAARILTLLKRV